MNSNDILFCAEDGETIEKAVLLKKGLTAFVNTSREAIPTEKRALHEQIIHHLERCFVAHRPKVEAVLERAKITQEEREYVRADLLTIPFFLSEP